MVMHPKTNVIVLVGLSGSGKSTIGLSLSKRLDVSFIDIDDRIEQNEGASITEIFTQKGEGRFRELERETVLKLDLSSPSVLALGGGAWMQDEIRGFLSPIAKIIYLEASVESILQRLKDNKARPLLDDLSKRKEVLEQQLETRKRRYAQATITVNANAAVLEVIQDINQKLKLS
jgi:shikimate kinase